MPEVLSSAENDINARIGKRIRLERERRGWSLSELAQQSGVSRAMIHKVERGESSPTATLLARLSGAFDMSMSQLIAQSEMQPGMLLKRHQQPIWQDPATGYVRRHVSPQQIPADLVSVTLPAGVSVGMPSASYVSRRQLIWVLSGELNFQEGERHFILQEGDCLALGDPADCVFSNFSDHPCHYAVLVIKPGLNLPGAEGGDP